MTEQDLPETDHTDEADRAVGELPAAGDTSPGERTDPRTPDLSGTLLTIAEAAERYAVSTVTLGRRLRKGEVPEAHKRPSPKGDEWVIPAASLVSLGYAERGTAVTTSTTAPPVAEPLIVTELSAVIASLTDLVEREQRQLEAAQEDRTNAQAQAADLGARLEMTTAELERERARAEALAAELAQARQRRGLFRRKG